MYFDLNMRGGSLADNLKLAGEASVYGWNHINFSYSQNEFKDALKLSDELNEDLDGVIDFDFTLEIKSNNTGEIRKLTNRFRDKASCIAVIGGDLKVNRAAVENVKVDVLSRPYLKRRDSGLNHVLAKEAVYNNVAIELCFKDILKSYFTPRAKIISNFRDIYTLYKKFDFPLVLSSRSKSVFDIKTPQDFTAVFAQTGLDESDITKSFKTSQNILKFNAERHNMILRGVRRVNDEA